VFQPGGRFSFHGAADEGLGDAFESASDSPQVTELASVLRRENVIVELAHTVADHLDKGVNHLTHTEVPYSKCPFSRNI
jgi:hypothetical protein